MKEKLIAVVAALSLFIVAGLAIYCENGKSQHTVVIDLQDNEDPFVVLPQLLPQEQITSIRAVDRSRNEYKIIVTTRKEKQGLLDWILGSDKVEHARIDD